MSEDIWALVLMLHVAFYVALHVAFHVAPP